MVLPHGEEQPQVRGAGQQEKQLRGGEEDGVRRGNRRQGL